MSIIDKHLRSDIVTLQADTAALKEAAGELVKILNDGLRRATAERSEKQQQAASDTARLGEAAFFGRVGWATSKARQEPISEDTRRLGEAAFCRRRE